MAGQRFNSLIGRLGKRVDPRPLALFRIIFGAFMVYEMIDYLMIGLVRNMYVLPAVNFTYDFLEWLHPLPEPVMTGILVLLLGCAVCILLGLWLRPASLVFATGYAYLFLLDKGIYNNHIYLFILLALLLSVSRADTCLSARNLKGPGQAVPFWQIGILQLQFVIVYFYGGIAKLTYDWIVRAQPVTMLVGNLPAGGLLARVFQHQWGIWIMNYGGLLLDLGAPVLLWSRRVRRYGIYLFVFFHLVNSQVFQDIGIFPFIMLLALLIFYSPADLPWLYRFIPGQPVDDDDEQDKAETRGDFSIGRGMKSVMAAYVLFQLLMPFRGFFLPNDLDWTTIGNRFSWRMKVDSRQILEMSFFTQATPGSQPVPVDYRRHLNDMQLVHMSKDPRSIVQYARYLSRTAGEATGIYPEVHARIMVRYNERPAQYFIQPEVDLARARVSAFRKIDWLYPVREAGQ